MIRQLGVMWAIICLLNWVQIRELFTSYDRNSLYTWLSCSLTNLNELTQSDSNNCILTNFWTIEWIPFLSQPILLLLRNYGLVINYSCKLMLLDINLSMWSSCGPFILLFSAHFILIYFTTMTQTIEVWTQFVGFLVLYYAVHAKGISERGEN